MKYSEVLHHSHDAQPSQTLDEYFQGDAVTNEVPSATQLNNSTAFPNSIHFHREDDFAYQDELLGHDNFIYGLEPLQWALVSFQQPLHCPLGSLVIGSRLDADKKDAMSEPDQRSCRLAFFGPIKRALSTDELNLKIFHWKLKSCEVFRLTEMNKGLCREAIAWKLVSEGGSMQAFVGLKVEVEGTPYVGIIHSPYGSDGKFKVKFLGSSGIPLAPGTRLLLRYKRFIHDKLKSPSQAGMYEAIQDITPTEEPSSDEAPTVPQSTTPLESAQVSSVIAFEEIIDVRRGIVESIKQSDDDSGCIVIASNAFTMEENIKQWIGSSVDGINDEHGELIGPFAKMGKCKIKFKSFSGKNGDVVNIRLKKLEK